jgi:hypothetical protein
MLYNFIFRFQLRKLIHFYLKIICIECFNLFKLYHRLLLYMEIENFILKQYFLNHLIHVVLIKLFNFQISLILDIFKLHKIPKDTQIIFFKFYLYFWFLTNFFGYFQSLKMGKRNLDRSNLCLQYIIIHYNPNWASINSLDQIYHYWISYFLGLLE